MSLRFRLVFAGACAVLVALVFVAYGDHVRAEAEQVRSEAIARYGGEVVSLVVANDSLEPGDVVSERNVSLREWVADLAPEDALTSLDDAIGREVSVPVGKNAPVTELAFRDSSEIAEVPEGHVAVSVPVTDSLGISRGVPQGSSVIAYEVTDEGSSLVSDDITVLSAPAKTTSLGTNVQVTLAVASDDVARLLQASANGDLRLVLPADDVDGASSQDRAPEDVGETTGAGEADGDSTVGGSTDGTQGEETER